MNNEKTLFYALIKSEICKIAESGGDSNYKKVFTSIITIEVKKYWKLVLLIGGLLPIIRLFESGVSSILIFSIFVLVFLWERLRHVSAKLPLRLSFLYIILGTFLGGLTQLFVQLEGFEKTFSPDPIVHFLQALTIYFWVTVVWYLVLRKNDFSTWGVFWTTGIWGVAVEAIAIYGSFNILVWFFIFLVYGSYATTTYLLTRERFAMIDRKKPNLIIYPVSFGLLVLALFMAKISIFLIAIMGIR